jgi:hypothetical protein
LTFLWTRDLTSFHGLGFVLRLLSNPSYHLAALEGFIRTVWYYEIIVGTTIFNIYGCAHFLGKYLICYYFFLTCLQYWNKSCHLQSSEKYKYLFVWQNLIYVVLVFWRLGCTIKQN